MTMFAAELFNGVVDVIVRDGSEIFLLAAAIVTGFVLFWLVPPEKKVREARRKVKLQAQAKTMKVLEDYYEESGDEEPDQGEHDDLWEPKLAPPVDSATTSEGGAIEISDVADVSKCLSTAFSPADEDDGEDASGVAASDVDDVADVFMRLSRAFSSVDESEDEDDHQPKLRINRNYGFNDLSEALPKPTDSTSGEAASEVDQVTDVFLRLSRAFSSADESEDEDDHVLPKPTDSTSGEAASEVDQVADVFVRLSRAFSSVDEDDDEDEDEASFSRWKPTGSTSREAVSEVDSVNDVFMRLSRVFSLVCEDDDDDVHDSSNLPKPKLTPSTGLTSGDGDVNVVHVADVFLTMFKVLSSVDADQDEDDHNFLSLSKPQLAPCHGVAEVFMKLSKVFSSLDEDDVDDEYDVGIPLNSEVTPTLHALTSGTATSDVDQVARVFLRLSKAFPSYDDEPDYDLMIAQKAEGTASSDGSTYGGATSDSEDERISWEASDSEGETHAETTD